MEQYYKYQETIFNPYPNHLAPIFCTGDELILKWGYSARDLTQAHTEQGFCETIGPQRIGCITPILAWNLPEVA